MTSLIYKIADKRAWHEAAKAGVFHGAPNDIADGFIHFSTAEQVRETAAKHFAGRQDLVLIAIDAGLMGTALRYEVSRGGAKFPHLYASLDTTAVEWVKALPLGSDGTHLFPDLDL